jgi:2-dehydropantoate 2-reductase
MRIAIMGAGGVGAYVGARLQAAGEDVAYVARGAHLAALQREGLRLQSPAGDLHLPTVRASGSPADIGPVDLVVFAVKLWDTEAAAAAMKPMLAAAASRVLTLQNGIDSVDIIARHVPRAQVVGGSIYLSAHIARPGVIVSPGGFHRIIADAHGADPVVAAFCEACTRAPGIEATATDDAERSIWEKFVSLSAVSGATALLRSTIGPILAEDETRAFLRQLIDEGVAVASASGHPLPPGFADNAMRGIASMPPNFRSSMAEDLDHGRRLELQWLSGRMHGLGMKTGVPTPAHTAVYRGLLLHVNGASKG